MIGWGGDLCSIINKTAELLDRMARAQHTFHFALQIFWKHFSPSSFKQLCASYTKVHVGWQVKHTLFVFLFYNNMSIIKDAHCYSKDA